MHKYKVIYGVDWLQVYGHCNVPVSNEHFTVEKKDYGNSIFEEGYEIYDNVDECPVGEIYRKPRQKFMRRDAAMFRFKNELLYRKDGLSDIMYYADMFGFKTAHISRLDIFIDFQETANGLTGQELATKLATGYYLRKSKGKINIIGSLQNTDKRNKEGLFNTLQAECVRYGNRRSECSVYLYNKSLELKEVKDKPYIRKRWEEAGFDLSKPVWRLEFSLHQKQLRTLNKITKETFRLDLPHLQTVAQVENLSRACIKKWFDIRLNTHKAKTERLPRVTLFQNLETYYEFHYMEKTVDTVRSDKLVIKKLWQTKSNLGILDEAETNLFEECAIRYAEKKDLLEWFYQCVKGYKHHKRR